MDIRSPRDGRVIEELGIYDPMVKDVNARAILNGERIAYWLGVGAQPSESAGVLIKKYGQNGTHLAQQKEALELTKARRRAPMATAMVRSAATQSTASQSAASQSAGRGSKRTNEAPADTGAASPEKSEA